MRDGRWGLLPLILVLGGCPASDAPKRVAAPLDVPPMPAGSTAGQRGPKVIPAEVEEPIEPGGELPGGEGSIGQPAPGFALSSLLERDVQVRLLKNRVTIIHFWATWCGPCTKSLPLLEALRKQYVDRVAVVGVSVDDEKKGVAAFAKSHNVSFPIVWDEEHHIALQYKVQTMPQTFVIDRNGIVRTVLDGFTTGDETALKNAIDPLF